MKCKGRCKQEQNLSDKGYCLNKTPDGDLCMYHKKVNREKRATCRVCGEKATNRGYCNKHFSEYSKKNYKKWYKKNKEKLWRKSGFKEKETRKN